MKKREYILATIMAMAVLECIAQSVSGKIAGHDYVDLGLPSGVMWATCNLGADEPTDYGDEFAWGETKRKDYYLFTYEDYKWADKDAKSSLSKIYDFFGFFEETSSRKEYKFTKYTEEDKKRTLECEDDAATVQWGNPWRMPDKNELMELYNSCQWEFVYLSTNPVTIGFMGTSKHNGEKIFLPQGRGIDSARDTSMDIDWINFVGCYWSANRSEKNEANASCIALVENERKVECGGIGERKRFVGIHVRAVSTKK